MGRQHERPSCSGRLSGHHTVVKHTPTAVKIVQVLTVLVRSRPRHLSAPCNSAWSGHIRLDDMHRSHERIASRLVLRRIADEDVRLAHGALMLSSLCASIARLFVHFGDILGCHTEAW